MLCCAWEHLVIVCAWAVKWMGYHCFSCAAVLDRLGFQYELESEELWPVDESTWKHVHLNVSVAMVQQVHLVVFMSVDMVIPEYFEPFV